MFTSSIVENPPLVWLCIGIVLMLAEIIVPGGIVIMLGASCLVVAGALSIGLIDGLMQSLTLWFIASIILLIAFRGVTQKLVGGESHVGNTDEELEFYNQVATVKQTIGPAQLAGRIEFQGTEWSALGDGTEIKAGTQVRIICRDNIGFIVEPEIEPNTTKTS